LEELLEKFKKCSAWNGVLKLAIKEIFASGDDRLKIEIFQNSTFLP